MKSIGEIGATPLFVDGNMHRGLTTDFLFPAWLVPVAPADVASLEMKYLEVKVDLPRSVLGLPDRKPKKGGKAKGKKNNADEEQVVFKIPYLAAKPQCVGKQDVLLTRPATLAEHEAISNKKMKLSTAKTKHMISTMIERSVVEGDVAEFLKPADRKSATVAAEEKVGASSKEEKALRSRGKHLLK